MELRELFESSLATGESFKVNDKITIRIPTIREIFKYGQADYFSILHVFTSCSSDYKSMLDDMGKDWQTVEDFELFKILYPSLRGKDLSILFGDTDMKGFLLCVDNQSNEVLFHNPKTDAKIDRVVYEMISGFLCAAHKIEKNREYAQNEPTRLALIEEERDIIAAQKLQPPKRQTLRDLVIAMSCAPEFKADYFTAQDYPINLFLESFEQVKKAKHYDYLMQGIYAGTVDPKKQKKSDLVWY